MKVAQLISENKEKPFIADLLSSLLKKGTRVQVRVIDDDGLKTFDITDIIEEQHYFSVNCYNAENDEDTWFELVPEDDDYMRLIKQSDGSFLLYTTQTEDGSIHL